MVPSLKGPEGGSPSFFLPKDAKLANLKCQKGSGIIGTPEHVAKSNFARWGAKCALGRKGLDR